MGKSNRARRAAKVKKRQKSAKAQGGSPPQGGTPRGTHRGSAFDYTDAWDGQPIFTETERIAGLWDLGVRAIQRREDDAVADVVRQLSGARHKIVEREAERDILGLLGLLWANGWQPSELIRFVRRSTSASGDRLAESGVLVDHSRREASTLHPAWAAQVEALTSRAPGDKRGWVSLWGVDEGIDGTDWIESVLGVLAALYSCGPLEELIPPPGSTRRSPATTDPSSAADPVLEKVRALLAQAESTSFEAEAEVFTAKAQELMTRHAIDLAMVAEADQGAVGGCNTERPETIRVPIDDPYVDMKSLMLQVVAEVSRCRAIFHPRYAFTTVVGFAHDLSATEMLFTSLLVQAQSSLAEAGRNAPAGARTRSRSFKSSFLMGYANRVGERLTEINRTVAESAERETSRSVLPALVARADVVDEEMQRRFPDSVAGSSRAGYDQFGYRQGSAAADLAQLSFADLSASESAEKPDRGDVGLAVSALKP